MPPAPNTQRRRAVCAYEPFRGNFHRAISISMARYSACDGCGIVARGRMGVLGKFQFKVRKDGVAGGARANAGPQRWWPRRLLRRKDVATAGRAHTTYLYLYRSRGSGARRTGRNARKPRPGAPISPDHLLCPYRPLRPPPRLNGWAIWAAHVAIYYTITRINPSGAT